MIFSVFVPYCLIVVYNEIRHFKFKWPPGVVVITSALQLHVRSQQVASSILAVVNPMFLKFFVLFFGIHLTFLRESFRSCVFDMFLNLLANISYNSVYIDILSITKRNLLALLGTFCFLYAVCLCL